MQYALHSGTRYFIDMKNNVDVAYFSIFNQKTVFTVILINFSFVETTVSWDAQHNVQCCRISQY